MFRIKICGVTRPQDGHAAGQAGADAIGLNFYKKSPRHVDIKQASEIGDSLPSRVASVGVFVNHSIEQVIEIYEALQLDFIQLHGDETPNAIAQLGERPVIRAMRWTATGSDSIEDYLNECQRLNCMPTALLIDAHVPGRYGGTGCTADWDAIGRWCSERPKTRIVLAGGLRPDNVTQAIRSVRPAAVDTASGVESSAGKKDHRLIKSFVDAAQSGFAE